MSLRLSPHKRFLGRWIALTEELAMVRNEPKEHTHSGPGDGGYVDFAAEINDDTSGSTINDTEVSGTLSEAASGTTTVSASSQEDVQTGLTDRQKHYVLTAHPGANQAEVTHVNSQPGTAFTGAILAWDPTLATPQWVVRFRNNDASARDFVWKVYEP